MGYFCNVKQKQFTSVVLSPGEFGDAGYNSPNLSSLSWLLPLILVSEIVLWGWETRTYYGVLLSLPRFRERHLIYQVSEEIEVWVVMFPWEPRSSNGLVQLPLITGRLGISSFPVQEIPLERIQYLIGLLLHLGHPTPSVNPSSCLSGDSSSNSFILPIPIPSTHLKLLLLSYCRVPLDSLGKESTQMGMCVSPSSSPTFSLSHGLNVTA